MGMHKWALQEVARMTENAGEDAMYIQSCCESALKAFRSLLDDGHSGMSIGVTKSILMRLLNEQPLTPIDEDCTWNYLCDTPSGDKCYTCDRMRGLSKTVASDGSVTYGDSSSRYCVDVKTGATFHNGFIHSIIDEMFPITFPYYPNGNTVAYCSDCLTNTKHGDFDTIAVLYVVKGGVRYDVNRYFKAAPSPVVWEEICADEYYSRVAMAEMLKSR